MFSKMFFNALLLLLINCVYAQKNIVDQKCINTWQALDNGSISAKANYFSFTTYNQPIGAFTLTVESTLNDWKVEIIGGKNEVITRDEKWLIVQKNGDSLYMKNLNSDFQRSIPDVIEYNIVSKKDRNFIVYRTNSNLVSIEDLIEMKGRNFESVDKYFVETKSGNIYLETSQKKNENELIKYLIEYDVFSSKADTVWSSNIAHVGAVTLGDIVFSEFGSTSAFIVQNREQDITTREIWVYNRTQKAFKYVDDSALLRDGIHINLKDPILNNDGSRIFFWVNNNEKYQNYITYNGVSIWSGTDKIVGKAFNSVKSISNDEQDPLLAIFNIKSNRVVLLTEKNEKPIFPSKGSIDCFLIRRFEGDDREANWNLRSRSSFFIVSSRDGSRKVISDPAISPSEFPDISPTGKWVIYYNKKLGGFFSYEVSSGVVRNITKDTFTSWKNLESDTPSLVLTWRPSMHNWLKGDSFVVINDNNDLWLIDPSAKRAAYNFTNGFGKKHNLKFYLAISEAEIQDVSAKDTCKILLSAFNRATKASGFYEKPIASMNDPSLLTMGHFKFNKPGWLTLPLKAKDTSIYLVYRMSATDAPNYFITKNFIEFHQKTWANPIKEYNWLSAELCYWKDNDGNLLQGILYKPENFDSMRKYPVIFNLYERMTENLNYFLEPSYSIGAINIPWFVSRGYLVFCPDIYYEIGHPGESAYRTVSSAVTYLRSKTWIESNRMALQGHSWGGFEVNYIITRTDLFCAAVDAAGVVDFVSDYGLISHGGLTRTVFYESTQSRIGQSLWENPNLFIENSPIFNAIKVKTPLLIMHNKKDDNVPYTQGLEWFNSLRRNGKKVWWLQYKDSGHVLGESDAIDYTSRLTDFFGYFLLNLSKPEWLK